MNAIATTAPAHLWKEASTLIHQLFGLFGEPQQIARQQLLGRDAHALLCKWLRAAEMFLRQMLLIEASALPAPPPERGRLGGGHDPLPVAAQPTSPLQVEECSAEHPESWRVSFRVFPLATRTAYRRHPAGNRHRTPKTSRDETYRYDFIDPENARAWKELQRGASKQNASSPLVGEGREGGAGGVISGNNTAFTPTPTPGPSPQGGGEMRAHRCEQYYSAWPLARRAEALLRAYNDPLPYAQRLARKLHVHPERAESIVDSCANPYAHHGVIHANLAIEIWTCSAPTLRTFAPKRADSS